jgi:inner membrane protein
MSVQTPERAPGLKLGIAILVAFALTIPLMMVWLLVIDRQSQSEFAKAGIAEGWGGAQVIGGPLLVIPYRAEVTETATENGAQVTRTRQVWNQLTLAPEASQIETDVSPERRTRSIYEVVVYEAATSGRARFAMPADLARFGVSAEQLDLGRAELRFGLSDPRGLGANPRVSVGGRPLRLQPGAGSGGSGGSGFFAWLDAAALASGPIQVDYAYGFRGNGSIGLVPRAGDTSWRLRSPWPHPSFHGAFLPSQRRIGADGFEALYRVGNLALGQQLVSTDAAATAAVAGVDPSAPAADPYAARTASPAGPGQGAAQVGLIQPVDLYSQVNRATKYGFLFIGFTFLAFLMFDLIGGVRVAGVEYLLVGAGLVLFFVMLLALAEVIGFMPAYLAAAAAITGLNTAYSAAVLKSWRRAGFIGSLLGGLYAVLYVLLSLEAYSLLIGALMLFLALAAVMYLTRNLNWGAPGTEEEQPAAA